MRKDVERADLKESAVDGVLCISLSCAVIVMDDVEWITAVGLKVCRLQRISTLFDHFDAVGLHDDILFH